jgi:hypothetical protein
VTKHIRAQMHTDLWCLYMDAISCTPKAADKLADDLIQSWRELGLVV